MQPNVKSRVSLDQILSSKESFQLDQDSCNFLSFHFMGVILFIIGSKLIITLCERLGAGLKLNPELYSILSTLH